MEVEQPKTSSSESKKVEQLHSEVPKLKLLSSESTKKKIMGKIS